VILILAGYGGKRHFCLSWLCWSPYSWSPGLEDKLNRVLAVRRYAGCVYGTCPHRRLSASTIVRPNRLFIEYLENSPTGSFFDAVDRVKAHGVFMSLGFYRGRHCVVLASTTALASRTLYPKRHKKAPWCGPLWFLDRVLCACAHHKPSSGESGHVSLRPIRWLIPD